MPKTDPTTGFQICSKCGIPKDVPHFGKGQYRCKECQSEHSAQRYIADQNHREAMKSRAKARYNIKREEILQKAHNKFRDDQDYRARTIERTIEYNKLKYQSDVIYRRKYLDFQDERNRGITKDGTVTSKSLEDLYSTWNGVCPFCNRESDPTLDHIIPISKGGIHSITNLQLMCKSCNSSKGNRT